MKMITFAKRCAKEILRDPLNLLFGLGFPLVLLMLLSAIQANIPVPLFHIDTLTPGITVFGLPLWWPKTGKVPSCSGSTPLP